MATIHPFARPEPEPDFMHEAAILSIRYRSLKDGVRGFAQGIHEYAKLSGDAYIAQEAQTFLEQLEKLK